MRTLVSSYLSIYPGIHIFSALSAKRCLGANPNVQREGDEWSPLFIAAMLGKSKIANILLQVKTKKNSNF